MVAMRWRLAVAVNDVPDRRQTCPTACQPEQWLLDPVEMNIFLKWKLKIILFYISDYFSQNINYIVSTMSYNFFLCEFVISFFNRQLIKDDKEETPKCEQVVM